MARRAGMTEGSNPVTVALTGHLSGYLLLAAVLTWPIALGLLRLYTRAVRRSMRSHTPTATPVVASPPLETSLVNQGPGESTLRATLRDLPDAAVNPGADRLLSRLITR